MKHSDPSSGAMRLLVVEDDKLLRDTLATSLQQAGFEVDCESSGLGADTALTNKVYSLVILDIGLPRMDGFEVLQSLRERGQRFQSHARIIAEANGQDRETLLVQYTQAAAANFGQRIATHMAVTTRAWVAARTGD